MPVLGATGAEEVLDVLLTCERQVSLPDVPAAVPTPIVLVTALLAGLPSDATRALTSCERRGMLSSSSLSAKSMAALGWRLRGVWLVNCRLRMNAAGKGGLVMAVELSVMVSICAMVRRQDKRGMEMEVQRLSRCRAKSSRHLSLQCSSQARSVQVGPGQTRMRSQLSWWWCESVK